MQCFSYEMKIKKLNEDSSWLWEIDGLKVMVDPWFSASQVDLHPLFSEQFHVTDQPSIKELEKPDYLFISHPFTDHCNKETLLQFDPAIPLIAKPSILRKIGSWKHFTQLLQLEDAPFSLQRIQKGIFSDLVHEAYLIQNDHCRMIYAPHGAKIKRLPSAEILITTTTTYRLPFWLGGTINLGDQHALKMKDRCNAKWLITTHDEKKSGSGLVERLAHKHYPSKSDEWIELHQGEEIDF